MRIVFDLVLGGLAAAAIAGAACAQSTAPPRPPAASEPKTAASKQIPTRNPAVTASENAKEPGNQRPEERVIPQISIPLKPRNSGVATAASVPAAGSPGGVNEAAARCLAVGGASQRAACERGLAASGPQNGRTSR